MAKPPKPGKCVHCLRHPVERNWDHVFPRSWYPETTAKDLAKWQIPSCLRCNRELGAIEQDFFVRVVLCLDPKNPGSQGLHQKALRAMKPEFGTTPSDKRARESLARRITSEFLHGEQIPDEGHYPSLGERWGRLRQSGIALLIPVSSFQRITEKIVRGVTYFETKQYIEPPHKVQFFAVDDDGVKPIRELLDSAGITIAREPGIVIKRLVAPEDGISAIFEIEFWKQFKSYASVLSDS